MYGNTAGVEPADARSQGDPVRQYRDALTLFNETAKAACDIHEHKLQREAEDAAARCIREIGRLEKEAREGERRREALHGENPQAAEVIGDVDVR